MSPAHHAADAHHELHPHPEAIGAAGRAQDLAARWQRARLSALRAVVGEAAQGSEAELLACALEVDPAQTFTRVFDNSARLGAGFKRHFREHHTLATLPALLGALGVPCLRGAWRTTSGAALLERPPCAATQGAGVCDWWREAIDGLVAGLSDEARHARHRSLGHGDGACLDVLYDDPEGTARFGPLPPEVEQAAQPIARLVRRLAAGVTLELLGVSEGVLLYRLQGQGGAAPAPARALVEGALAQKLPGLHFKELSPRAVYDTPL